MNKRKLLRSIPTLAITILLLAGSSLAAAATNSGAANNTITTTTTTTTTPIKHLIVIFQENISFDHILLHILMLKILLESPHFWLYQARLQ